MTGKEFQIKTVDDTVAIPLATGDDEMVKITGRRWQLDEIFGGAEWSPMVSVDVHNPNGDVVATLTRPLPMKAVWVLGVTAYPSLVHAVAAVRTNAIDGGLWGEGLNVPDDIAALVAEIAPQTDDDEDDDQDDDDDE